MKSLLWVPLAATTIFSFPLHAEETVRLSDGRTLILSDDGTYTWPQSERYISITLTGTGKPSGFMSDDRDCDLSFNVINELDGTLIGMSAGLEIIDSTGAKLGVCQRSCPPISCSVSDFRGADFGFGVEPDGSCGLPVAGFA
jgi:hypothetical protein